MASPQLENGYTRIANEIMEALAHIRISGEAWQVLGVIIRKTYGFNKKEDKIALSQFCLATGLKKNTVCRGLHKLFSMNLITKKENGIANIYALNKDFDTWKPLPKKRTFSKKRMIVLKKENESFSIKSTTKETKQKTLLQKTAFFEEFWKCYPKRKGREQAWKVWNRVSPSYELTRIILSAVTAASRSEDWLKNDGQYIPYPATYLNGKRWEDENTGKSSKSLLYL